MTKNVRHYGENGKKIDGKNDKNDKNGENGEKIDGENGEIAKMARMAKIDGENVDFFSAIFAMAKIEKNGEWQ